MPQPTAIAQEVFDVQPYASQDGYATLVLGCGHYLRDQRATMALGVRVPCPVCTRVWRRTQERQP